MSQHVSVEEAQARLPELVAGLGEGDSVILMSGQQPVARLTPIPARPRPVFGNCRGKLSIVHEDDEHLADFGEYMP
jgi:antitoxin (DNA-binding transcriptional repressor) of toxin-antitoxin stability system